MAIIFALLLVAMKNGFIKQGVTKHFRTVVEADKL